jgi:hypothetical protein
MSSPIADNKMLGRKFAKIIVIFNIISEWRVKVVGNQSCVRLGKQLRDKTPPEFAGAGSHRVATYGSDRVSSLVEYERRLNSW